MKLFISKLWQFVRPYKGRFLLGAALGVLAGLKEPMLLISIYVVFVMVFKDADAMESISQSLTELGEVFPGLAEWLNGLFVGMQNEPGLVLALSVISIIPITMFVGGVMNYGYVYCMNWVGVRAIGSLRARVFDHLLHLPPGSLQKLSTGELMSRVSNDIGALHSVMRSTLVQVIRDPITLIVLVVGLLGKWPGLTLLSSIILPLCVVPIIVFTRKMRKSAERTQNEVASVFESMHEGLTGVRVVKAYNLEDVIVSGFRKRIDRYNGQYMRVIRAGQIPGPLIEFFGSVGVAVLLAVIVVSNLGYGTVDFLTFVISLQFIYTKIKLLVRAYTQMVQADAATRRVFELLDMASDLPEPLTPTRIEAKEASIQFDNITFGYDDGPLFEHFNLNIEPGQLVALVGLSGSGKTTLANLLLRFYDPQEGAVRINGVDIRDANSKQLRSQISVVAQETILFNESIRRNIELGRPGATLEEIQAAARMAHADDFVSRKEGGYEMVVGEKGSALSGGQKQRLAIARAILKDAPILILDEATSALDTEAERAVQAGLDRLMEGRTTICIAHRLSTVQHADLIVVLDRGRIVERGTHAELLAREGLYRKLYEMQFREN